MVKLTVSEAIIKFLENQYSEQFNNDKQFIQSIDTIAGIFGHGNVCGIGKALRDTKNIRYIRGHNEQGLGNMAIGYAKENCCRKNCFCLRYL